MRRFGLALVTLAALSGSAGAQDRLTIVVPFAAGGGIDIFARLMGEQIGKSGAVSPLIEDRPGASSMIGTEYVARAAPDGATVLISSNSTLITPALRTSAFDPLRDLRPVCNLAESPQLIVVKADAPYKSLGDLAAAARKTPGALTIASNGPASTQHLASEMFKHVAGIEMTYVPYPGGAPAVTALIGGQVAAVTANLSEVHGAIDAGQIRALATTASRRIASAPSIPTAREEGLDFDIASWHGVALPAKASDQVAARVESLFMAALNAPELRAKLEVNQYTPTGFCGAEVADFMRKQVESIGAIAKSAGIHLE